MDENTKKTQFEEFEDEAKKVKDYLNASVTKRDLLVAFAVIAVYSRMQAGRALRRSVRYTDDSISSIFTRAYRR